MEVCSSDFFLPTIFFNVLLRKLLGGKSAIITGLQVALGAKASTTNRGQSQKDLIKTGEEFVVNFYFLNRLLIFY